MTGNWKQQHKNLYPQGIAQNEKPIRIDSLTKLDLADVLCMEYMSAGDSSTYLLPIDSLLPFWSKFPLQWQDWKLKGKEKTLEKFILFFSIFMLSMSE